MPDKPRCRPAGGARSWVKSGWLPADAGSPWSSEAVDKPGAGSRAWALHCRLEHADQICLSPCGSCGQPPFGSSERREAGVLEETHDNDQIIQRVAALDVGKAELTCCIRVPGPGKSGKRLQEVRTYQTMTRSLLVLADRLGELGVTRVVMEATSDYWRGVFYLLEAHGFQTWLVNARDVKHLPGRPKTDTLDAVWLCKLAERQLLRPSFVPPQPIRQLRDVTRYRAFLIETRTAEKQRVEKLLVDAQINLSVVASDSFGVSGRAMLAALIAGERDPKALAQLARTRLRAKLGQLEEAFCGHFSDHHGFLLARMLGRIDQASADIAELEAKIDQEVAPFAAAVDRLDEICGVGRTAAQVIIAEVGLDMAASPPQAIWPPG